MATQSEAEAPIVAPAVRDLAELERTLTAWLSDKLEGARDVRLTDFTYPRGAGQSHETILFDARWCDDGGERMRGLVVRVKPTSFTVFDEDLFVEQYRLMSVLADSGTVRVARPLWLEEDPSLLGAPFFIMEKRHGRVAVSIPSYMDVGWVAEATAEQRALLWRNAIAALGSVQSIPLDAVSFLAPDSGADGFAEEWDRWERYLDRIDTVDRRLPEHRRALETLRTTMPAERVPGIVWGDARLGNMMVGDDFEIVALMDWEQPSLGGALHDLGWWLFIERGKIADRGGRSLPGILSRSESIALWAETTGLPTGDADWYEAFAGLKIACLAVRMLDMREQRPPGGNFGALPQILRTLELLS